MATESKTLETLPIRSMMDWNHALFYVAKTESKKNGNIRGRFMEDHFARSERQPLATDNLVTAKSNMAKPYFNITKAIG